MLSGEVIVFDVETTGTDRRRDQVIELCVQFGLDRDAPSRTWRFKPAVPINPGAQAVHGISMEDLADCPPFSACAADIRQLFDRARVLVGYNMSFDIDMLQAEYERLREPFLALDDKQLVDAYRLWQQCEPRSLLHAHQRFVGDSFDEAHSAGADVAATGRVLRGMLAAFGLADQDWSSIASVCEPERASWVGPTRHFRWAEDDTLAFNFGRYAGRSVVELAQSADQGYLRWVLGKDFPPHVHAICQKAVEQPAELHAWARSTFPSPPVPAPVPVPRPAPAAALPAPAPAPAALQVQPEPAAALPASQPARRQSRPKTGKPESMQLEWNLDMLLI